METNPFFQWEEENQMRLSAKERVLKAKYVGTFRAMSKKELEHGRKEVIHEVEEVRKIVANHTQQIKASRAALRKSLICREAIRQVELEQAETKV